MDPSCLFRLRPHVERGEGEAFCCFPFNPKSAIRNSKWLIVLLSLAPLFLCTPAVVHAQWEPDVRLTYNDSSSYTLYWNNGWSVAAGPESLVHVVWTDTRDGGYEVYYKRSTNRGLSWEQDRHLVTAPSWSDAPTVAISVSAVHVVWMDGRYGNWEIFSKRSGDGGVTWYPDRWITNASGNSIWPSLAVSGNTLHAAWRDERDGNPEVYYARSTNDGISWLPDVRLTNHLMESTNSSVAVSGSTVHLAWDDDITGQDQIYYKRSTDNGLSWTPDTLLDESPLNAEDPAITVAGSIVHVVWYDYRNGYPHPEIYYKRSTDGGTTWFPDMRLTQDTAENYNPSIAVSGNNVHLVWYDDRDGNYEIYYKRSTDGGATWDPDTRLTRDTSYSEYPSISVKDSVIHVVWSDWRDGNAEIYYKRNPTGNPYGVESPEKSSPIFRLPLSVYPNPFTSFATLPGHEAERFVIYDISGRKVGVYKGDRVGEGLGAGVYFLKPEGKEAKPLRIIKLR